MMSKRFYCNIIRGSRQVIIIDCHTCKSATIDVYNDDFKYFVELLNEQQSVIDEQNRRIRKLENILKKFQFPVERVGE